MAYRVLTDDDVMRNLTMSDVIRKIEDALREKAQGTLVAPPRFHVDAPKGSLVFTAGAATQHEKVIGFRVYDTFQLQRERADTVQLVAVFDSESGDFKGVVIGSLIGALRTGAIGGVAIKHMSRPDSEVLGILGTGNQARTQLEAAVAVRQFSVIKVYSPTSTHRKKFADEMGAKLDIAMEAVSTAREVVQEADVLICATISASPVFDPEWLKAGVHINTVGPKFKGAHEIDIGVAARSSVIATDSVAQIEAYTKPFFLLDTLHSDRIIELSDIVVEKRVGRSSPDAITLFCSVGLAATEVVVANAVLERTATEFIHGFSLSKEE